MARTVKLAFTNKECREIYLVVLKEFYDFYLVEDYSNASGVCLRLDEILKDKYNKIHTKYVNSWNALPYEFPEFFLLNPNEHGEPGSIWWDGDKEGVEERMIGLCLAIELTY